MKTVKPRFFDSFKCTAGSCSDNCCIGWEIDIDDETLLKYKSLNSPFAAELNKSYTVSDDGSTCFRLCENERCIHLDENNLCRIISKLGEDYLCEICREHPRFYAFLPDRTECGLGLCCEEACRLLLTEGLELINGGDDETSGDESEIRISRLLFNERENILRFLLTTNHSYKDKITAVRRSAKRFDKRIFGNITPVSQVLCDSRLIELMKKTEAIDSEWLPTVEKIEKNIVLIHKSEKSFDKTCTGMNYETVFAYLVYRHFIKAFDDGEALAHIDFCVNFMRFLKLCDILRFTETGRQPVLSERIESIKYLSKQLEYSEENTDLLTFTKEL